MPKKLTKEEVLKRLENKFGETYKFSMADEYTSNSTPVQVGCPVHGLIQSPATKVLYSKYACSRCGDEMRSIKTSERNKNGRISWNKRVEQFNDVHGNRYTYDSFHEGNYHSKIRITCPIHGIFYKHMFAHMKGSGCYSCSRENTTKFKKSLVPLEVRKEKAKECRTKANKNRMLSVTTLEKRCTDAFGNKFKYDWTEYQVTKKVRVACPNHGVFETSPDYHYLSKHGCPSCAACGTSKMEQDWLLSKGVTITQYSIFLAEGKKVIVDGVNSQYNTIYEFLGDYWHGHPRYFNRFDGINPSCKIAFTELYSITEDRFNKLTDLGFNIIYVWEHDIMTSITTERKFSGKLDYE